MRLTNLPAAITLTSLLMAATLPCGAQCPSGLNFAGRLYAEGSHNSNFVGVKEVLLPAGVVLDSTYHQLQSDQYANGQQGAFSHFTVSQVPAGLWLKAGGANGGWAVGDGPAPVVYLEPAVWDTTKNTISQYKFGMRLYCTTGSGTLDMAKGGCNVRVDVCYKSIAPTVKPVKRRTKKASGD